MPTSLGRAQLVAHLSAQLFAHFWRSKTVFKCLISFIEVTRSDNRVME
jgi:hypothetical protein